VNNAAITRDGLAVRMKPRTGTPCLRTNLTGAHLCAQQALSVMMRARYGRIINVTSVVAETGNPGQVNYVAAKAGIDRLDAGPGPGNRFAQYHGERRRAGIHRFTDDRPVAARRRKTPLLARMPARPHGLTMRKSPPPLCFLASEEAGYITGAVLDVNGGLRMG
jgi:3-oxoacyl-[acyl-carrier protein] reductase